MFRGIRSGSYEARRQVEDGVDRVRVVDPICADQRGINRAGLLAGEEVMEKIVAGKQVCERRLRPPILITNDRGEIRPIRMVRISRGIQGMGRHVAETARHAHPEWANQLRVGMDGDIRVVVGLRRLGYTRIPVLAGLRGG